MSVGPIVYVEGRANSYNIEDDFEHLVAHAMSCTLESGVVLGNGVLRFESLHQVFNDDDFKRFEQGMECLDQGKARGEGCTIKEAA